jgi:hypothetical protein
MWLAIREGSMKRTPRRSQSAWLRYSRWDHTIDRCATRSKGDCGVSDGECCDGGWDLNDHGTAALHERLRHRARRRCGIWIYQRSSWREDLVKKSDALQLIVVTVGTPAAGPLPVVEVVDVV